MLRSDYLKEHNIYLDWKEDGRQEGYEEGYNARQAEIDAMQVVVDEKEAEIARLKKALAEK